QRTPMRTATMASAAVSTSTAPASAPTNIRGGLGLYSITTHRQKAQGRIAARVVVRSEWAGWNREDSKNLDLSRSRALRTRRSSNFNPHSLQVVASGHVTTHEAMAPERS